MPHRLATLVAFDLALCGACSAPSPTISDGQADREFAVAGRTEDFSVTAATSLVDCGGDDIADVGSGTERWLRHYDALPISGIAADHRGNLVVARSGAETLALGCDGQVRWSVPFGDRVAVDGEDSVYVAGTRAAGAFVVKLDSEGNVLYDAALPAETGATVESLAVDSAQNVAISGALLGTAKLDPSGALLWSRPLEGRVAFDLEGDLWLAGALEGTAQLGSTALVSAGGSDVLLLELAADGALVSAHRYGDEGLVQRAEAIAIDGAGNVLLAGTFDGVLDFGAGPVEHQPQSCSTEAWCVSSGFLAKLDPQGGALWSVSLGLTRAVGGLAVDASGDIAVSSTLPGGVRPFRRPELAVVGPDAERRWQKSDWPGTGVGAGRAAVFDANHDVIWGVSARPSQQLEEESYLAKLAR